MVSMDRPSPHLKEKPACHTFAHSERGEGGRTDGRASMFVRWMDGGGGRKDATTAPGWSAPPQRTSRIARSTGLHRDSRGDRVSEGEGAKTTDGGLRSQTNLSYH